MSCRCNRTNHVIQSRHIHRPRASTETRVSRKVDVMPLQLCQNNELLQIIGGFEVRYAYNHPTTLLLITAGSHYKAIQDGMQHQARGIIDKASGDTATQLGRQTQTARVAGAKGCTGVNEQHRYPVAETSRIENGARQLSIGWEKGPKTLNHDQPVHTEEAAQCKPREHL